MSFRIDLYIMRNLDLVFYKHLSFEKQILELTGKIGLDFLKSISRNELPKSTSWLPRQRM